VKEKESWSTALSLRISKAVLRYPPKTLESLDTRDFSAQPPYFFTSFTVAAVLPSGIGRPRANIAVLIVENQSWWARLLVRNSIHAIVEFVANLGIWMSKITSLVGASFAWFRFLCNKQ